MRVLEPPCQQAHVARTLRKRLLQQSYMRCSAGTLSRSAAPAAQSAAPCDTCEPLPRQGTRRLQSAASVAATLCYHSAFFDFRPAISPGRRFQVADLQSLLRGSRA